MKIVGWPAFENRNRNPYNSMLYGSLQKLGHTVKDASLLSVLRSADIFHLHWPELFLNHGVSKKALFHAVRLFLFVGIAKITGKSIVWTVHNIDAHEGRGRLMSRAFYRLFPGVCDRLIFLSAATMREAAWMNEKLLRRATIVPHGSYLPIVEAQVDSGNTSSDVPQFDLLMFGMLRRYKNVPELIDVVKALPNLNLLVAGAVVNDSRLELEIREAASGYSNISVLLRRLDEGEMVELVRSSRAVILPYREIANSGSAIFALSVGRPVIAPNKGMLPELQQIVGSEWLQLYDGEVSAEKIETALSRVSQMKNVRPDLSKLSWDVIATQTVRAYSVCRD